MPRTLVALAAVLILVSTAAARTPVLVDTDVGEDIDDALALALVLNSPELEVRGITTVHGDTHTRALVVCRMLHLIGKQDVPVASGGRRRTVPDFNGQMQYGLRPSFRKGPVPESAVDFLHARLKADPGNVTLLAVECLCACEAAPMMQVDDRYELNLTREKVDAILGGLA